MPAFLLLLLAAIALPPKPTDHVTDRAGVLKYNDVTMLDGKLSQFERQTSDQILVYIDQHLPPDTSIEEMGSEAMRKWGVGQKGKDNGAILFVFVGDRKMRIEVGYGLEGSLTDARSKHITSTVIKPEFQRGDYAAGVMKGVDAMLATVRGEEYRGTGKTVAETSGHRKLPNYMYLVFIAIVAFVIFIARKLGLATGMESDSSSSSSSSSGGESSSSSDSFEGGGGSGGGGGASDSW
jgi:uncharacterized protein